MTAGPGSLLPQLPTHWSVTPVRYASTCLDGKRVPLNIEERSTRRGDYPYWGANGVVDSIDEYLFDEPLVLLGEDGAPFFDKTKPVAFFVTGRVWVNNHIHVLRLTLRFDPRFIMHCLNAADYGPWIEGSTREKLTQDKMGSIPLPTPPLREQRAIADFLERETARIDTLVAAKERLLTILAEKRQALISRAVTKGLDPDVPTKDSGSAWFGSIPAHWEVRKLKWMCRRITDGSHYSPPTRDDGRPYVTVANVVDDRVDVEGAARIDDSDFATLERNGCRPSVGDVLFSKDGSVGKVAVVENDGFVILSSLARLSPTSATDSDYLAYFLKSKPGGDQVESHYAGAALRRITLDTIVDLLAVQPPLHEQHAIVAFIKAETAKLDAVRAAAEKTIGLLKERRAALIAAAVTGKVDVPLESGVESART